ncbi:hypothetical protein GCM10010404_61580 [Nonomuraea africana]|uniref:Carboxylic ester hydrolase n=1 Tax=Nonomuraea africana TaxID=46171 RepID=A0ABR9K727_9ACTN|nr:carboxylesterase family protein [Nonomuraea africana]MBE1557606.1 acetyl esterase/lipase [Nonomuraea africana]
MGEPGEILDFQDLGGLYGTLFGTVLAQGEDCLSLTVRTPDLGAAGLPVLVWLHGGGFAVGSGGEPVYQGGAFAGDGVVEVTVNHRLGVDGYAVIDDPADRVANLGLLDQLAALAWVRDNIERFGGDPALITLAGQSAGAMAVACLLTSPRATGLIHRAIVQSAMAPLAVPWESAARVSAHLAELLGIPAHDAAALAAVPRAKLLQAQRRLCDDAFADVDAERFGEAAAAGMAFLPVVDGDVLPEDATDCHWFFTGNAHAFADYVIPLLAQISNFQHSITNPIIELHGDRAFVECQWYVLHHMELADGSGRFLDQQIEGRYVDVFERRERVWKILHRQTVTEAGREFVVADLNQGIPEELPMLGKRAPDDIVYANLSILDADLIRSDGMDLWEQARARHRGGAVDAGT